MSNSLNTKRMHVQATVPKAWLLWQMAIVQLPRLRHDLLFRGLTIACALLLACSWTKAQLAIDTTLDVKTLVGERLLGKRVKVNNIRYFGSRRAIAYFSDQGDNPLIGEGIMLSTGDVFNVQGPNKVSNMSTDLQRKGDRALQYIGKAPTHDAAMLEFDFKAQLDFVSFNFFFASEEYTEYVGSTFNDVFAFYISGPGINGTVNLAVLPGKTTPITVNSVNHISNTVNYIDNDNFGKRGQLLKGKSELLDHYLYNTFEFDGMTTLLRAETQVIPGEIYHIRICIADVGDFIYDSAVFLEGKSFSSYPKDPERRAQIMADEAIDFRRRSQPGTVGAPVIPSPAVNEVIVEPALLTAPTTPSYDPMKLAKVKGNPWLFEFAFDSHQLTNRHKGTLDTVADYLKTNPKAKLRIEGHTDNVGGADYNLKLSQRRAESVRAYLATKGIGENRLTIAFFGYDRPKDSNAAETGRAHNRRVEIILLKE